MRGLGGNLRDWCAHAYAREGAAAPGGVVDLTARAGLSQLVAVRGGAHVSTPSLCRAASPFATGPDARFVTLGFRLARPFRSASS